MHLFHRVGALLDTADQTTSDSDLHSITRGVAGGARGAVDQVKRLDFGLAEGWNELTKQVTGDLREFSGPRTSTTQADSSEAMSPAKGVAESPSKCVTVAQEDDIVQVLRERIQELEAREEERLRARDEAQKRFDIVGAELSDLRESSRTAADPDPPGTSPSGSKLAAPQVEGDAEHEALMEAMRREFRERQATVDSRVSSLEGELAEANPACEKLEVELSFWKEKTQRMLEARGLSEVPQEIQRAAECSEGRTAPRCSAQDSDSVQSESSETESEASIEAPVLEALAGAREERDRLLRDCEVLRAETAGLEERLAELLRESDATMERVEAQRLRERELQASLAAATATAAAEAATAEASRRRASEAQAARDEAERELVAETRAAAEAQSGPRGAASDQVVAARQEIDNLRREAAELERERAALDARLRKRREAAVADLERAVPLSSASCWRGLDGPSLKAATALVRSACLRRTFALHLLATYLWLFFLIFWLEKHP